MERGGDFPLLFAPDGDIALVDGPATVAQDIDQALKLAPGALYWDKEIGSAMLYMLNDSNSDANSVIAELERVAIADARVNPASVKAHRTVPGKFRLEFTPMSAIKPETLDYDLTKGGEA